MSPVRPDARPLGAGVAESTFRSSRPPRPTPPLSTSAIAAAVLVAIALVPAARAHDDPGHHRDEVSKRIDEAPGDASLYILRADLSRALGDWIPAVQDLQTASRLDPGRAEVDFLLARVSYEAGNDETALDAADRFAARRPSDAAGPLLRARILMRLGRKAEATESFTTGIRLAKASGGHAQPDDYLDRARCQASAGDAASVDAAVRGLDEGAADLSGAIALELLAVDLEVSRSGHDAAVQRLAAIESRATRKETWAARRAEVLEKAGREREAAAAWRECLAAIAALPERLRGSRSVRDLETRAASRLAATEAAAPSAPSPMAAGSVPAAPDSSKPQDDPR